MRMTAIVREAWLNIRTGTARTAVLAAAAAIAVLTPLLADQLVVRQLTAEAERFQTSGASVLTLTALGRIDGVACEALGRLPGVRAAGAVRAEPQPLVAAGLPSAPIPSFSVTPGFAGVLRVKGWGGSGVVLSDQAADTLGIGPGGRLQSGAGAVAVDGVYAYPDDGRRGGFGYAALIPTIASEPFDECWVDAWPQNDRLPALLLTAVRPSGDSDADHPAIGQLNATLGSEYDGAALFDRRVTVFVAPLAAALSFAVGFAAVRARRLEFASALHAGVPRRALLAIGLLESLSWMVPVQSVGFAVTAYFVATTAPSDGASALLLGLRVCLPAAAAAALGVAAGIALTLERHLVAYFKDR